MRRSALSSSLVSSPEPIFLRDACNHVEKKLQRAGIVMDRAPATSLHKSVQHEDDEDHFDVSANAHFDSCKLSENESGGRLCVCGRTSVQGMLVSTASQYPCDE